MQNHRRVFLSAFLAMLLVTTYARNEVWKAPLVLWEDVTNRQPQKARSYNYLGSAYKSAKLYEKALRQFRRALLYDPELVEAHFNIADIYYQLHWVEQAIEQYKYTINLAPDYEKAHYNIGVIYLERGMKFDAYREFTATLNINPEHEGAKMFLRYLDG